MPLIDDTDFKTREESVVYNQSGLDLVWNFVTTAGAYTQTAVTPTESAGNYDWTNEGNGMYAIEIPASGGASINNDTEGFGWFTGFATGILPWRGPVIGFRAAGLNNALIDSAYSTTRGLAGTALPDAAADAAGGLIISDAGALDADAQLVTKINSILDDTDLIDDATSGLAKIATDVAAVLVDTADMQPKLGAPSDFGSGTSTLAANLQDMADNGTATFDRSTDSLQAIRDHVGDGTNLTEAGGTGDHLTAINLPNQTMDITGNITGNLSGSVGSVTGNVDGNVTGSVGSVATGGITADSIAADAIGSSELAATATAEIADAVLTRQMTESYAADGVAPTTAQALFMIQQMLTEFAISSTTLTVKKLDGSTTAATLTLDDATNPTSLTRAA